MPPILQNVLVEDAELPAVLPYLIQQGAGSVPDFLPSAVPGLIQWLRSDIGITIATGVGAWTDLSGSGNNVSQANTTKQPAYNSSDPAFNGWPSLSFTAASSQLLQTSSFTILQPFTIIAVGSGTGNGVILGDGGGAVAFYVQSGTLRAYAGTVLASTSTPVSPAVLGAVINGATSSVYFNSSSVPVAAGAGGASNMTAGIGVGDNGIAGALQGKLAEVLVYNAALTQSQLHQVFYYLAARYGIVGVV